MQIFQRKLFLQFSFFCQSKLFKKLSKALIGGKIPASQKATFFGHVNRVNKIK